MNEDTYRDKLTDLQVEVEELRAKLKEAQTGDLISRQAAIDALHMHLMYRMGTDSNKKRLDEWINNLPSAQPEQQWIPCSERLPEKAYGQYWVCTDTGYQCQCRWTDNVYGLGSSGEWTWKIFDIPQYSHVVAWMPLPEAWKGEQP